MAIAFGSVSTRQVISTGTTVSVSGSNTLGFIMHSGDTADNLSGITWGGIAMTKVGAVRVPSDAFMSLWYIVNPASAAAVTCSGSTRNVWWDFYYTGCAQTGQPDSSNTGTSSASNHLTIATTVVAANCWTVFAQFDDAGGRTYTVDVGLLRVNDANGSGGVLSDSNGTVSTGSQSTTLTQTVGTDQHAGIVVSIAPAPTSAIKTFNGLAKASVKTVNALAIASVKTINGLN